MRRAHSVVFIFVWATVSVFGGKNVIPAESPVIAISPAPWSLYIGIGGVMTNVEKDPCQCVKYDGRIKDHRYGTSIRVGIDFNEYLGIEIDALKTYGKDAFSETTHYGIYMKPQYKVSEKFNLYGLVGYGKTKIAYNTSSSNCEIEKDGVVYGLGLEYDLSDTSGNGKTSKNGWRLWVDYKKLLTDEGISNTSAYVISAGAIKGF